MHARAYAMVTEATEAWATELVEKNPFMGTCAGRVRARSLFPGQCYEFGHADRRTSWAYQLAMSCFRQLSVSAAS